MAPTMMMTVWSMVMPEVFSASTLEDTTNGFTVEPSTPAVEPSRMVEAAVMASNPAATMVAVTSA